MRVIAGAFRSRRLRMPVGARIRPTADRVKEGMFNCIGADLGDLRVLDLYAGSGSLGIEALSRGAANATFVENRRECIQCLKDNIRVLELASRSHVVRASVERALNILAEQGQKFDLVLSDPPYFQGDMKKTLHLIVGSAILTPSARVVLEHHRDTSIKDFGEGLTYRMTKRYGDSAVSFLTYKGIKLGR